MKKIKETIRKLSLLIVGGVPFLVLCLKFTPTYFTLAVLGLEILLGLLILKTKIFGVKE